MLGAPVFRTALFGPWSGNALWTAARAVPSLDLCFADKKDLICASSGRQLISFARASSGTYTDSAGVLRTATTNLLLRSEEFDDASWAKTGCTIAANTGTAPNGTLTADQQTHTGSGPRLTVVISGVTASAVYTLSFYAKQQTSSFASVSIYDSTVAGNRFWFNISTGQMGTKTNISTGYPSSSHSIQAIGDGWYRCVATFTNTSSSTITVDGISVVGNTDGALTPSTSGLTGLLWGAQLEQSATVGEYIPTTSTINSAPRFDHNPLTGESLGLLVEEQRTNLLLNSATLSTQSVTVAAVAHTLHFTGTGTVTLSGTSTAGPLVGAGTGEANRVSLTFTPTAGTLTLTVSGTVTNAQLEAGAFRTSYIPTTTAAATRNADVAQITGTNFSSWYRQDEGTLYAETRGVLGGGTIFSVDDGTTSNRIIGAYNLASIQWRVVSGGVEQFSVNTGGIPATAGALLRYAHAYRANNFGGAANGTSTMAVSSGSVPSVNRINIGSNVNSVVQPNGHIRRLTYWPQALPGQLQAITQP